MGVENFPTCQISLVQSLRHVQFCDPMDCSTPGLSVHNQLLELIQTYVHWVGDAIQSLHPLFSPSPPAFNLSASGVFLTSQLFASDDQSIGASVSASVLPKNIHDWFLLGFTGLISLLIVNRVLRLSACKVTKVKSKSLSSVRLFATPWTVVCRAPLSMEFSRQEYWSG